MRFFFGLLIIAIIACTADRAGAVGRTPGGTLQWLGWGFGEGYHAPIAQAHPPLRRAVLHAPGGHLLGPQFCCPSRLAPAPFGMGIGGMDVPYDAYQVAPGLEFDPPQPIENLPQATESPSSLPDPPFPPEAR